MLSTPSGLIPPPPFFSPVRLPDIDAPRGPHSVPPPGAGKQDPLFRGPGLNWQQRRRDIEAELQKGFDLPDPFRQPERARPDPFRQPERNPLFGRPPPAPKPPLLKESMSAPNLPPISGTKQNQPSPLEAAYGPPLRPSPLEAAYGPPQRPKRWRKSSHEAAEEQMPTPVPQAAAPPLSPMPAARFSTHSGFISKGGDLHRAIMTIDEAKIQCAALPGCKGFCHKGLPTESQSDHPIEIVFKSKWDNAVGTNDWTSYKMEAHISMQKESKGRSSVRGAAQARERRPSGDSREDIQDRSRQEVRRQRPIQEPQADEEIYRRPPPEAGAGEASRRQEEEDWESEMRNRLKGEQAQMAAERQRQAVRRVETEQERAEAARIAEAAAQISQAVAAEARGQAQAERARRRMQQEAARGRGGSPTAEQCEDPEQNTRHRRRHAKRQADSDEPRRPTPQHAAYMYRDMNRSSKLNGSAGRQRLAQAEILQQAEGAAVQQLMALQQLPTKKERQKGFKELLRAWHPDKNPQNFEVATAVFQRLQAERWRALGA